MIKKNLRWNSQSVNQQIKAGNYQKVKYKPHNSLHKSIQIKGHKQKSRK